MQYIDCFIDPITRIVAYPAGTTIVQRDTNVEILKFHYSLDAEHALENDSIRIMVLKDGETYGFSAENVRIEINDGGDDELVFEHTITTLETVTPGPISVSVCGNQVSGDVVTEAWHTLNMTYQVTGAAHTESDEGEDTPETMASNAEKIAALQVMVDAISSGNPVPVESASMMEDESVIYLYTGNEEGYYTDYWYYYEQSQEKFIPGAIYGSADVSDEKIQGFFEDWLDEHPEATTTVQDGSITYPKFSEALKKRLALPVTVYGEYVGGYYDKNNAICAVAKKDGYIYTFEQIASDLNNVIVRKYDPEQNTLADTFTIAAGHCNSVCVYDDKFYILPMRQYASGSTDWTEINEVRIFDDEFSLVNTISIQTRAFGISVDESGNMYYFDTYGSIYKFNGTAFTLYCTTNFRDLANYDTYIQDFAVYNGIFYVSGRSGEIIYGDLISGASIIIGTMFIGCTDRLALYRLGEVEGMEFYDGVLYVADYATTFSGIMSYVLQIDIANRHAYAVSYGVRRNANMTVSDALKAAFKLEQGQLHCLDMLGVILGPYNSVYLAGDYTSEGESIRNTELFLNNHTMTVSSTLTAYGTCSVQGTGTIKAEATNVFNCASAVMRFLGALTIISDTLTAITLATVGASKPLISIANDITTTLTVRIGTTSISGYGLYYGSSKVFPV